MWQSRAWIGNLAVMLCEDWSRGVAGPALGLEAQRGALGRVRGVVSAGDPLQLIVGQLDQGLLLEHEGLELVGLLVLLHAWASGGGSTLASRQRRQEQAGELVAVAVGVERPIAADDE